MASSSSKRKRGHEANVESLLGVRDKAKRGPAPVNKAPRFARTLLQKYFWGEIAASGVQELAATAKADGLQEEMVLALSKVGSDGTYTGLGKAPKRIYPLYTPRN